MKILALVLALSIWALSQIEIVVEVQPEYSQTLSGNRAVHDQLAELDRYSY